MLHLLTSRRLDSGDRLTRDMLVAGFLAVSGFIALLVWEFGDAVLQAEVALETAPPAHAVIVVAATPGRLYRPGGPPSDHRQVVACPTTEPCRVQFSSDPLEAMFRPKPHVLVLTLEAKGETVRLGEVLVKAPTRRPARILCRSSSGCTLV